MFSKSVPSIQINSTSKFRIQTSKMMIIRLQMDGSYDIIEMSNEDIIKEARASSPISCNLSHGGLQPRDMRLFDPAFSNSHDPEILVRRHSVLVNLDQIKALILHNKCLVYVPVGADSLLAEIMVRLRSPEYTTNGEPFEIRSYEAVLVTVTNLLELEFKDLKPAVKITIDEVMKASSGPILERLRQVKMRMTALDNKLIGIGKALGELLQSDKDMTLMNLSLTFEFPDDFKHERETLWDFDHEEVELLLENYLQLVDGIKLKLDNLGEELDTTIFSVTMRLDTARNKLLFVELLVSTVTAVGTYGALVAALFGMNLDSGVQDKENLFWVVFGIVLLGSPLAIGIMFWIIKCKGLLIT